MNANTNTNTNANTLVNAAVKTDGNAHVPSPTGAVASPRAVGTAGRNGNSRSRFAGMAAVACLAAVLATGFGLATASYRDAVQGSPAGATNAAFDDAIDADGTVLTV